MLKSISTLLVALSIVPLFFWACNDSDNILAPGETRKQTNKFTVWGDYTNSTGSSPVFQFNADSSDVANVSFASIETTVAAQQVTIKIKNISLADSLGNYVIESNNAIVVEEKRENRIWINDAEFSHDHKALTKIAVVLVLDISGSLGEDFVSLKQFATEFVQIINENIPDAQIGLVVFSSAIETMPLTTNIAAVEQFIKNLDQGANSTALYDAMAQGINILNGVTVDGKALVTFTDGADNFSGISSSDVITQLTGSDIKSFTIGLTGKGNLDSQILTELAVSGVSKSANSLTILQSVFQRFSREITNVYNVTYTRNMQPIQSPMPIRFVIEGSINLDE